MTPAKNAELFEAKAALRSAAFFIKAYNSDSLYRAIFAGSHTHHKQII